MRQRQGTAWIGTSGWHYPHWVGPFYPARMPSAEMLRWYVERFRTVEINNTFYGLPAPGTFRQWRDIAPGGFPFACKASRYITHVKRLAVERSSLTRFFRAVDRLGDHLGPILFQLPPRWHRNAERLASFLTQLPHGYRLAFEFRDEEWIAPEVTDLLHRRGAAYCAYDFDGRQPDVPLTTNFAYLRLHGPDGRYKGRYSLRLLNVWARRIRDWLKHGLDVYCYFDNDEKGYAPMDARRLQEILSSRKRA